MKNEATKSDIRYIHNLKKSINATEKKIVSPIKHINHTTINLTIHSLSCALFWNFASIEKLLIIASFNIIMF